jgi:serine/threonine-protein kinase
VVERGEVEARAEVGADAAGPLLGRVIHGLRFDELIGAGGMGHVFRAEQLALERTVAVKVLHRRLVADDDARTRFTLEARAASRLEHPHVVAIHDLDELEDGRPYLVMEFLRGYSLAHVLEREGALPLPRALRLVGQVLAALAEGHQLGIVHRDVKPENVVLEATRTGGDHAKLVDFGLAFWRGRSVEDSGELVCGTPEYVSPESVRGEPVDARADLYSTGVMLFELLTGRRPFEGATPALTGLRHLTDPPPRLADVAGNSDFPDVVEAIVARALAKRPSGRYRDAHEMGRAVADALEDLGGTGPISLSPSTWDALTCAVCKSPNARRQRHCGHCGRRLSESPQPSLPRAAAASVEGPRSPVFSSSRMRRRRPGPFVPFVGRDAEIGALQDALAEAALGVVTRRLVGPLGAGCTTLLDRFLEKAELLGAKVARVAPDAFQSRVPFFAASRLVDRLQVLGDPSSELPVEERRALARDLASHEAAALARGIVRLLRASAAKGPAAPFLVAIDDFDAIDAPSRQVFERVVEAAAEVPMLLVVAHRPSAPLGALTSAAAVEVGPLPLEEARAFLRDQGVTFVIAEPLTPLHLEQLARFAFEAPGRIPPRAMGDVVHERMALLDRDTRRVLEFLASVPGGADDDLLAAQLSEVHGLPDRVALLRELGFVVSGGFGHRMAHPLFSAIALGTMALEARRRLYSQSFAVLSERGAPAEALASRAEEAGQPLRAMAVLERAGIERERSGEREAAFDAFSRAITIARREMVRAEFEHAEAVFVGLALRVARFLIDAGEFVTGAGLLDEAAGLALERPRDRVLVLAERAHLEAARRNFDRATAYLQEAAEVAREAADGALIRKLVELEVNLRKASEAVRWLSLPPKASA